MFVSPDK